MDTRPGGLTRIHLGFVCFFSWLNMAIGMAIGMAEKALNTAVVVINLDSTCCCRQRQESCKQQRSLYGKPTINYRWDVFRKLSLFLFALFMFPLLGEMIQVEINPSGAMLEPKSLNRCRCLGQSRDCPGEAVGRWRMFCLLFALALGIVKQLFACKTCKFIGFFW